MSIDPGPGLKIGEVAFDPRTKKMFEIIDEGPKGRGVRYLGQCISDDCKTFEPKNIMKGQKICYFGGEILEWNEDGVKEDDRETKNKEENEKFKNALKGWKKHYLVEWTQGVLIVPFAEVPEDISNIGFIINTAPKSQCNCVISKSPKSYEAFWKASKTIKPGDILTGFYSNEMSKKYSTKKSKKPNK